MYFSFSGYYKSLYVLVNHRLPSSLEYSEAPSIPLASTLLEHILKPLHFTYSSCTTGARLVLYSMALQTHWQVTAFKCWEGLFFWQNGFKSCFFIAILSVNVSWFFCCTTCRALIVEVFWVNLQHSCCLTAAGNLGKFAIIINSINHTKRSTFPSPLVGVRAIIASETNLQRAIKGRKTRRLARVQNIRLFALRFRHS